MLKQYFLSNLIILLFLNVLVKPVWIFLIDRNVQLTVGHDEYGMYSALFSLSIIFNILLDFGITNYNNRSMSGDKSRIHLSLPNMIVAKMLFAFFYFMVILFVAYTFNYSGRAYSLLLMLGGVQFLNSFLQFFRSTVSAHYDFKIDSVLSVLDKLIMIALCGLLLWNTQTSSVFILEWYLYAQLLAYSISILIAIFIIIRRYSKIDFRHFDLAEMRTFCIKSLPYALLILLMGIYMRSDSLLLERLKGPHFSSIYAEAYRVLDAFNMVGFLFAGILLPLFTRLIVGGHEVASITRMSTNIMLAISLAILGYSISYKTDIMYFLDHSADDILPYTYLLVITSFPAYCLMYVYTTLLTANGDIRLLIGLAVISCLMSVGLNLMLIPIWGVIGAAITAILVQYAMAGMCIYYCVQKFPFKMDLLWIVKFIALFLLVIGFNILLKSLDVNLMVSGLINLPFFMILVYFIRLWDREALFNYFKQIRTKTGEQLQ